MSRRPNEYEFMRFSPAFMDELRSRLSLVDVVSRRVILKKRGHDHIGLCPFHNEKTPSFHVHEDKGFYKCFGCGAHGDAIEFVMRTENLPFPEAVEQLARQAGVPLPVESPEDRARQHQDAGLYAALEAAAAWFETELRKGTGKIARDYLAARGLDEETLRHFRIGFAPDSRFGLKTALMARSGEKPGEGKSGEESGGKRFSEEGLVEAGLLIRPEDGGATYDRFRGRVIFPIPDRRGRVIAFGGRARSDVKPKYLNSPDSPVFHKGRVLYNFAGARKAAGDGTLIVAEGYMDVIAFHRAGLQYAVAPLGTALTEEQIEQLWRVGQEPILCFDGDEAGMRAAYAAAERALPILKPGCSLRFAWVPAGEDPDSVLRHQGPEALTALIAEPEPLSEVLWQAEREANPADTPERRAHLEQTLERLAGRINDPKVRGEYQRFFRDRFREAFAPQAVQRTGGPGRMGGFQGRQGPRGAGTGRFPLGPLPVPPAGGYRRRPKLDAQALLPKILLALVLNHPSLLEEVAEELGTIDFSAPELDKVRAAVLEMAAQPALESDGLKNHLIDRGLEAALRSVLNEGIYMHAGFASPDAPLSEARTGWRHAFGRYCLPRVRAQVQEAQKAFALEGTRETSDRLVSLQRHLHELQASITGTDDMPHEGSSERDSRQ